MTMAQRLLSSLPSAEKAKEKEGGTSAMKPQGILRTSMIVVGLGVASLLATPVRAQTEIAPDSFDINPGTPKAEIVHVAEASAAPVGTANARQENTVAQAAVVSGSNWDGMFAAPLNAVDVTMILILAVGTGFVAVYTVAATRRQRRFSPAQGNLPASTSGATTH
jgi:hypothetical protein